MTGSKESVKMPWDDCVRGWVQVHGPSVRDCFPGHEPATHRTCVAELNNHFVFFATEKDDLPRSSKSLLAAADAQIAMSVCRDLRDRCLVFLTQSAKLEPQQSFAVKFEDWQLVENRRNSPGDSARMSIRALVIDISVGLRFWPVMVNVDYLVDWRVELYNFSDRLSMAWRIRAGTIPKSELRTHSQSGSLLRKSQIDMIAVIRRERLLFLICHFFKYWEQFSWNARSDDVSRVMPFLGKLTDKRIQAEAAEAGCVRLSPYRAKRMFASLFADARALIKLGGDCVLREEIPDYGWHLAILFPENFSAQMRLGRPIDWLTQPGDA